MPELQSITLLEQQVPVSHIVFNLFALIVFNRTASGACCAVMRQELVLFRITGRTQVIARRVHVGSVLLLLTLVTLQKVTWNGHIGSRMKKYPAPFCVS